MQAPELLHKGKVRDTYSGLEPDQLVMVASDRISVFDVVLPNEVPDKGRVLKTMTAYWLNDTPVGQVMPHHMLAANQYDVPDWLDRDQRQRAMVVKKLDMCKAEAVVRGYLTGSGWKDYRKAGLISGIKLPAGMQEMEKFPEPIFTPSTKAEKGHDENIDFEEMVRLLNGDRELAERLRTMALKLYSVGAAYALERGIILVDTKFEFGLDPKTGELTLADEVLTPDSSRYVSADSYQVGRPPQSMDKQIVRDHYEELFQRGEWNKQYPAPPTPPELIDRTRVIYGDIAERLTGTNPLAD